MGKSYVKLLRHQVKKLAKQVEKDRKSAETESQKSGSSSSEEEEEEEVPTREPTWSDKGATISDKNAVKEFPGRLLNHLCKQATLGLFCSLFRRLPDLQSASLAFYSLFLHLSDHLQTHF